MVTFDELSETRKLAIRVIVREYPETMTDGKVTLRDLKYLFDSLKEKRSEGAVYIGFPIWLTSDKQFRTEKRGVYQIPLPTEIIENLTSEREDDTIVFNHYTPDSFKQELAHAGIDINHLIF